MNITVKSMEPRYVLRALDLVENVFTEWDSPLEGRTVRCLAEEIRSKKYYVPELELIAVNGEDDVVGYVMFSRFHIEGKYENELLILTPAAVKTEYQRQHISKQLIEYGFERAAKMGFKAVLVEGDPKNYASRGFMPSYKYGITAAESIHLPHPDCLMIKELEQGALNNIFGTVDYSFYDTLNTQQQIGSLSENVDWRLANDDLKELTGIYLNPSEGEEISANAPHLKHCIFCLDKVKNDRSQFMYISEDISCCICEKCFEDFKEKFRWKMLDGWDIKWDNIAPPTDS